MAAFLRRELIYYLQIREKYSASRKEPLLRAFLKTNKMRNKPKLDKLSVISQRKNNKTSQIGTKKYFTLGLSGNTSELVKFSVLKMGKGSFWRPDDVTNWPAPDQGLVTSTPIIRLHSVIVHYSASYNASYLRYFTASIQLPWDSSHRHPDERRPSTVQEAYLKLIERATQCHLCAWSITSKVSICFLPA